METRHSPNTRKGCIAVKVFIQRPLSGCILVVDRMSCLRSEARKKRNRLSSRRSSPRVSPTTGKKKTFLGHSSLRGLEAKASDFKRLHHSVRVSFFAFASLSFDANCPDRQTGLHARGSFPAVADLLRDGVPRTFRRVPLSSSIGR